MKATLKWSVFTVIVLLSSQGFGQQGNPTQIIRNRASEAVAKLSLAPISQMDTTAQMKLVIGLQLRNQQQLASLLQNLYDATSPEYHHWLSPSKFISEFGPTAADYQALIKFAKANDLTVVKTEADQTLLTVTGSVAAVQRAMHVKINIYKHPTENRDFYGPNVDPTINLTVPVQGISGLSNFRIPRPAGMTKTTFSTGVPVAASGSGPNNSYIGNDFRSAYAYAVSLNGHGQKVGLMEFDDGYYPQDISSYDSISGLRDVPLESVLIDNATGQPDGENIEVSLDIEMVNAMAPGLDSIIVYEGDPAYPEHILAAMIADSSTKQFSSSWWQWLDANCDPKLDEMAADGQSFFSSSGDWGAWWSYQGPAVGDALITLVGGTVLSTISPGGRWSSENRFYTNRLRSAAGPHFFATLHSGARRRIRKMRWKGAQL